MAGPDGGPPEPELRERHRAQPLQQPGGHQPTRGRHAGAACHDLHRVLGGVRGGSGGQPAGLLPHESPAGEEEIHDQLLHHESGGHGLPVRPHAALLGRGHGAGLHLAVWTRHVQGGGHGDRDERVRERLLPHRYERDALLFSCVRAQGPNAQQALLCEAGQRASVAPSHRCVGSHGDLLHGELDQRRQAVPPALPQRPALARSLSPAEDPSGVCVSDAHHRRVLPSPVAPHSHAEHEQQPPQAQVQSNQIRHDRGLVLLHMLAAQPRHHLLGSPGQV